MVMRKKKYGIFIYACVVCAVLMVFPVRAESYIITAIKVDGNQRVETETVKSYLGFKEGDSIDEEQINAALKKLFATGLFSDIKIQKIEEGTGILSIHIQENPIINKVVFEGNKRIDGKELEKETSLKSRNVYSRSKVQSDVKRIQELYRKSGRFAVTVEPKVIQLDQNRIDIVFEIDEGKKTTIRKVQFVGNEFYGDDKIEKVIRSKESKWYNIFQSNDTYDPDRIAYDKELLRKFYVAHGFADFKVTSSVIEVTKDKGAFTLTFTIEEGQRYHFGQVKVKSKLTDLPVEALRDSVETVPEALFNADLIEKTVDNITQKLNDLGYAFVDVETIYDRNPESRVMGLSYVVKEGPKVYVNKININGNVRTLDKVIRREFRLSEGDPFNAAKIRRSKQRIENLGFFEKVEVERERAGDPDKIDLSVKVDEKSTGELNFGVGYSTSDGALANVSLKEHNLLGTGREISASAQKATRSSNVQFGFTEPYFLEKDFSAGVDLFSTTRDRSHESSYDETSRGGVLRGGYSITEHLRHSVNYTLSAEQIGDVQEDASQFIKQQQGSNTVSQIGHVLLWDYRDNKFSPSEGFFVRFSQDLAGLGGDAHYIRNELRSTYYHPLLRDDIVFSLGGKAGHIAGWDDNVRIDQRFFVGGNNFRGFNVGGIGPRDRVTNDALGGNMYGVGSTELAFPLGLPKELGIKGSLFMDAGTLTEVDEDTGNGSILDDSSLRVAAGLGVTWSSPMGPVRIEYAHAFSKEEYDRTKQLNITYGTGF